MSRTTPVSGTRAARETEVAVVGAGSGHPFESMLRVKGYDGVISIEHEDSTMSVQEGFEKAVSYLRGVMIQQPAGAAWWF